MYFPARSGSRFQQTQIRNSRPSARVPAPGCAAIGRQVRWYPRWRLDASGMLGSGHQATGSSGEVRVTPSGTSCQLCTTTALVSDQYDHGKRHRRYQLFLLAIWSDHPLVLSPDSSIYTVSCLAPRLPNISLSSRLTVAT